MRRLQRRIGFEEAIRPSFCRKLAKKENARLFNQVFIQSAVREEFDPPPA